eukprot:TRINITY_DN33543_c0_g1_i2.p1 TRINITY_DN33543_c0_g1~~TRINITY_DN33543_c0_g1_i2.p1  ORF type:complete len:538 (+),score=34.67 TRINITY_DN33543_c0_g1_i2:29-1615(+)
MFVLSFESMPRFNKHSQMLPVRVRVLFLALSQHMMLLAAQHADSLEKKAKQLRGAPPDRGGVIRDSEASSIEERKRRLYWIGPANCPDGWVDQTEGFSYWYDCAEDCDVIGFSSRDCKCACVKRDQYIPNLWGGLDELARLAAEAAALRQANMTGGTSAPDAPATPAAPAGPTVSPELAGQIGDLAASMRTTLSTTTAAPMVTQPSVVVDLGTLRPAPIGSADPSTQVSGGGLAGQGSESSGPHTYPATTVLPYSFHPAYFASTSGAPAAPAPSPSAEQGGFSFEKTFHTDVSIYVIVALLVLIFAGIFSVLTLRYHKKTRVRPAPAPAQDAAKAAAAEEDVWIQRPRRPSENSGRHWIESQIAHKGHVPSTCPSTASTGTGSRNSSRVPSKNSQVDGYVSNVPSNESDKVNQHGGGSRQLSASPGPSRTPSKSTSAVHEFGQSAPPRTSIRSNGSANTVRTSIRSNGSAHPAGHPRPSGRSGDHPTGHSHLATIRPSGRSQDASGHLRPSGRSQAGLSDNAVKLAFI